MEKSTLFPVMLLAIIMALFANMAFGLISQDSLKAPEKTSPSDTIKEDQIKVYSDQVIINVSSAEWSEYADTNSMDPVIDSGANGIVIRPKSEAEIKMGDIVSYQQGADLVVHRIVGIGSDEIGTFYTTKGDNNSASDPEKVRFGQIKYKTIAIIY